MQITTKSGKTYTTRKLGMAGMQDFVAQIEAANRPLLNAEGKDLVKVTLETGKGSSVLTDDAGNDHAVAIMVSSRPKPKPRAARTDRTLVAAGTVAEGDDVHGRTVTGLGKAWWMDGESADGVAIAGRTGGWNDGLRVQYAYHS